MSRFYFVDGTATDNICEFVDHYQEYYYLDGPKGVIQRSRSSRYVEHRIDALIEEGIKTAEDVWLILAWKIGGINHRKSIDSIELIDGWKQDIITTRFQEFSKNDFDILAEYVSNNIDDLSKSTPDEIRNTLLRDVGDHLKGIGATYLVTLIYFITKGAYPIYDAYAAAALEAIKYKKEIPAERSSSLEEKLNSDKADKKLFDADGVLAHYKEGVDALEEELRNQLNERYVRRDLDRALWVYGHLFHIK